MHPSTFTCRLAALLMIGTLGAARAVPLTAPLTAPQVAPYGATPDGIQVERVTLSNRHGMRVSLIDYGAALNTIEVPDRGGRRANVILSMPSLPAYLASKRRFGTVGRNAGFFTGERFTLDGQDINLHRYGAPTPGFERRIWRRRDFADARSMGVIYTLVSPAGDQGFPGTLTVTVTYRLLHDANELSIEYLASTDAPTVVNLTNHSYFNLAGAGTPGLAGHVVQVDANRYVAVRNKIPTGELPSVTGTPVDFRQGGDLAARMAAGHPLLGTPAGFDHGLVLNKPLGSYARVARLVHAPSGRSMEVSTSSPSIQLFTGSSFDGSERGAEGRAYLPNDGVAFEAQFLADSPNHPEFPSAVLRPGQQYRALTTLRFSADGQQSGLTNHQ